MLSETIHFVPSDKKEDKNKTGTLTSVSKDFGPDCMVQENYKVKKSGLACTIMYILVRGGHDGRQIAARFARSW